MNNIVILDDDNNSPISLLSCKPVNKNETQYPVSMNSNTMNNAIDVSTDFHDNYMMAEIDSSLSGNISIKEQAVKALVEMSNKSKSEVQKIVNNCCSELLALKVVYNANTLIESCFEDVLQLPEIINLTSTNSASTVSLISNSDADLYLSKRQLVNRVLSIFPNAKMTHVEKLISDYSKDVNKVIQSMAEHGYEKEAKSSSSSQVQILDFNSLTSFEPSPQYKEQVMLLLQINFPYIKVADIKSMLSDPKFNYHYTLILRHLEKLLEVDANIIGVNDKNFHTLEMVMKKTSKLEELKIRIKKGKLSHINNYFDLLDNLDPILFDELTVIKQQKVKKSIENDRQMALKLNEEIAIEEGTLIECGCCYSEYCFEQMAQCSEGHLFCKECISRYVENTVFGEGKSLIKCMNTGKDACCGFYPDSMLQSALNEVVFAKYQEALARDVIKSAHLEVVTCFDCSFVAELAQDAGYIMACPRCNKETCRLCGEESHIPLKCSEVEKKGYSIFRVPSYFSMFIFRGLGQTEVRLTVEEAMTQARVRECPKCKTR